MKINNLKDILKTGCISNCRNAFVAVVGEDTDHGGFPWLVSPPASEKIEMHLNI
jgi:hypothetical protein